MLQAWKNCVQDSCGCDMVVSYIVRVKYNSRIRSSLIVTWSIFFKTHPCHPSLMEVIDAAEKVEM